MSFISVLFVVISRDVTRYITHYPYCSRVRIDHHFQTHDNCFTMFSVGWTKTTKSDFPLWPRSDVPHTLLEVTSATIVQRRVHIHTRCVVFYYLIFIFLVQQMHAFPVSGVILYFRMTANVSLCTFTSEDRNSADGVPYDARIKMW